MTQYKLNDAERGLVRLSPVPKTKQIGGRNIVTYSNYMDLAPGKVYHTDDEALLNYFRTYKRKVRYTAEIEKALKENNVPYEVIRCKSCGGSIKKISYQLVEVME